MISSGIIDFMDSTIERLSLAIDAFPAAYRGNRLNLLFLNNAYPIKNSKEFLAKVDSLMLQDEKREYLLGTKEGWPFPTIKIESRPDPWKLTDALFENFEFASEIVLTQQDICNVIIEHVIKNDADIVILIIVDGLSYYDLPEDIMAIPCLVRGITATEYGFRDVVGKPAVSQHLFNIGYKNQLAFTFFDRDTSSLSVELHSTFGSSQLYRINSIEEGINIIKDNPFWRGFIQIVAPGLDKISHYHADRPMVKEYLDRIFDRLDRIIDCLSSKGKKVTAFLTSDHGILWRDNAKDRTKVIDDVFTEDRLRPRYIKGSLIRNYAKVVKCGNHSFTLLKAPYMTRDWKHSEWGVHGGISAWESIVPIIIKNT